MQDRDHDVPTARRGLSRRTVLGTAAWSVPAITLVTAAPAMAASGTSWVVSSSSWEGSGDGTRSSSGSTIQFRFLLEIPANVTVLNPQCVMTFNGATTVAAGTLASITSQGWVTTPGTSSWTFTRAALTGGVSGSTATLNFQMSNVSNDDTPGGDNIVFSSSTPDTGPSLGFTLLVNNLPSGTDPAGYNTTGPHPL